MTNDIHLDEDGQATHSCCGMPVAWGHTFGCISPEVLESLDVHSLTEYAGGPNGYLL